MRGKDEDFCEWIKECDVIRMVETGIEQEDWEKWKKKWRTGEV